MEYSALADTYERLEGVSSKLKKAEILAEFLSKIPSTELEKVVLLVRGTVFPGYSQMELGIADKMIIKSVAKATGFKGSDVVEKFKKTGDLGLVAEECLKSRKQSTLAKKKLTIDFVFTEMQKLAEVTGEGSQEKKLNIIAEMIVSAKPKEARYIVRTILANLRIGVSDGLIRDAIVKSFLGEHDKKEAAGAVDYALNIVADFGEVARIAKEKGVSGLKKVEIEIGKPIQVMLAEKAASIDEVLKKYKKVAIEWKFDGMRCASGHTPIYVKDKGLISIKDVKVGDFVLTHKGEFKKVVALNKRKVESKEDLFKIQTYLGNEYKITGEHEVLANLNGKTEWIPVKSLTKEAELIFPIPNIKVKEQVPKELVLSTYDGYKKIFQLNKNFFRFLGFWVGDGYTNTINGTYRVGLLFNMKTEKLLSNRYKKIVYDEFGVKEVLNSNYSGVIDLHWTDRPLLLWLSHNFRNSRRGWKGKTLPDWFYSVDKERFFEFLDGWVESDGSTDDQGRTTVTTKERKLPMMAQLIALNFRKILGVKKIRVKGATYYKVIFTKNERKARIVGDAVFVKLLKLEKVRKDPRFLVYNLQIEDDESYCTTMMSLHNCQIHKKDDRVWLYTRRLEDVTKQFPDVVKLAKEGIKAKECVIEGEALGIDPKTGKPLPFQILSQRVHRKYDIEKMAKEIPVQVNLFDAIYVDGELLIDKSFVERRKILEKIIKPVPGKIQLAKQITTEDLKEAEKFYKSALEARQEGVMLKVLDSSYVFGRHVDGWIKIKPVMETLDLVIIGATWGEGARANWLTSFVLACRNPKSDKLLECGMMSTGLTEDEYKEMTKILKPLILNEKGKEVKVKPKIVVEVEYQEIQKSPTYSSGFALRFPAFKNFRPDRGPSDVDTISRVKKLYESQGRAG